MKRIPLVSVIGFTLFSSAALLRADIETDVRNACQQLAATPSYGWEIKTAPSDQPDLSRSMPPPAMDEIAHNLNPEPNQTVFERERHANAGRGGIVITYPSTPSETTLRGRLYADGLVYSAYRSADGRENTGLRRPDGARVVLTQGTWVNRADLVSARLAQKSAHNPRDPRDAAMMLALSPFTSIPSEELAKFMPAIANTSEVHGKLVARFSNEGAAAQLARLSQHHGVTNAHGTITFEVAEGHLRSYAVRLEGEFLDRRDSAQGAIVTGTTRFDQTTTIDYSEKFGPVAPPAEGVKLLSSLPAAQVATTAKPDGA